MATSIPNVFSEEDVQYLLNLPEVTTLVMGRNSVYSFEATVTDSIRSTLQTKLGIAFPGKVPMRAFQGDVPAHKDSCDSAFQRSYLVYLTDSPGSLVVDGVSHPIQKNTGYTFPEKTSHCTKGTQNVRRIMMGPFNETGVKVGAAIYIYYFANQAEAAAEGFSLTYSDSYTVEGIIDGYGAYGWISDHNTFGIGPSPSGVVYPAGTTLNATGLYYMYPAPAPPTTLSTNGISRSAPPINIGNCTGCVTQPVLQFSSASEIIEYKKRKVVSQYYTNPANVFPIKNRYASMYTTFKSAEVARVPNVEGTCCNNGQMTARSDGKDTPAFLYNKFNPT